MTKYLALVGVFFLTACAGGNYTHYLKMYNIPPPTPEKFFHCYNYGCQTKALVSLPIKTKNKLIKNFTPLSLSPEEEQKRIAVAIRIFEEDIGALTGTKNDKHGTFDLYQDTSKTARKFQQDCIDESTNTTIYLSLLENMELLKFYRTAFPRSRQPLFSGQAWWHQSATIQNIQSKKLYAVDSWFLNNGQPPFIIPLKTWKNGWTTTKKHEKTLKQSKKTL